MDFYVLIPLAVEFVVSRLTKHRCKELAFKIIEVVLYLIYFL